MIDNLQNELEKLTFKNIIPFIVLISLLIIMSIIYMAINKENQKLKNKLFLSWLIGLTIILIVVLYDIIINEFGYFHDKISQIQSLEKTVNRHNRELNALRDNTGP